MISDEQKYLHGTARWAVRWARCELFGYKHELRYMRMLHSFEEVSPLPNGYVINKVLEQNRFFSKIDPKVAKTQHKWTQLDVSQKVMEKYFNIN